MDRLIAPISRGDRGARVANLQVGLTLLAAANSLKLPDMEPRAVAATLAAERRDETYGDATVKLVAQFQRDQGLEIPGNAGDVVDGTTAERLNAALEHFNVFAKTDVGVCEIVGRVEYEDGTPGVHLRVAAFDRDIGRNRQALGDQQRATLTDEHGAFAAIQYQAASVARGEGQKGPGADLVFEIMAPEGRASLEIHAIFRALQGTAEEVAVEDLRLGFEAGLHETVRIVLVGRPGARPEYAQLMSALAPLLIGGATPADLDQEQCGDFDFCARESGWDAGLIETLAVGWRLARTASREPARFAETFYGLLRSGPPTEVGALSPDLSALLDQDARWAQKLEDSIAHDIVGGEVATHLALLRALRTDANLRPSESRVASLGDLLARAGIAGNQQRALVEAFQAHTGTVEEFWRNVAARSGISGEQIAHLQATLQIADLVGNDSAILNALRDRGVSAGRDLARLERGDWVDLVTRVTPAPDATGDTTEDKVARTVESITGLIEGTFPTDVVARIAATANDAQLTAARDLLARFFDAESRLADGFDVASSPATAYLEANGERVYHGLNADQRALLSSQVQRLQRVYRLGADRRQTEQLLSLGLDSAARITRYSPDYFVAQFGEKLGGTERASLVYNRAESITGTVLYLFNDLWQGLNATKPLALTSAADEKIPALRQLPTYRSLFGSLDLCDCEQCQSIFSPAAYFVDLLHMLDLPGYGADNPVEVLLKRRPDLGQIQLTCENTNTLIPYIDLVTEVLESFVANRVPVAFNTPPAPPNQSLPAPSAEELRVNPVYLTPQSQGYADQAYATLQESVFPLRLPLNLPLEITRVYLEHLGAKRSDLMGLFDRDPGLEPLMARAAEILNLSPEEFEIITGARFGGASATRPKTVPEFFGLSDANTPLENPRTLFNHVAPEFAVNPAAPDERAALIRSLQNVLSFVLAKSVPPIGTQLGTYDSATEAAVNAYLASKGAAQNGKTDADFWAALSSDNMASLSVMMCPVPFFLDRSGLSYEELIALVKTRFVNPHLQGEGDLDYLAQLGIPSADVRAWIKGGFPALPAGMSAKLAAAGEDPTVFTKWVQARVKAVVLNTSFEAPCDLDRTTLMHLDGTLLSRDELITLFRFIRLWRKLGWALGEMDLAIEPATLAMGAAFNTLLVLANLQQLRVRLGVSNADLVCLWRLIPTFGEHPLYDRLFRNRAAQWLDPIFVLNRQRTELAASLGGTPPALSDHSVAILAAFRVTAEELAALREAAGLADDPALPPASQPRLTLAALSGIYRYVTFARSVQLTVRDALALIPLTALDVFERPERFPRGAALQFADIVDKVAATGVKVAALQYLCRAVVQPPNLPGSQRDTWQLTLATLIDGLHGIAAEEPLEDDPIGEQLTARLTGVLTPDDARTTVDLIYGRDTYVATLAGLPAAFAFPAGIAHRVTYDAVRKQLTLRGALTVTDKALLLGAAGVPAAVQPDYNKAVAALDAQPRAFVDRALGVLFASAEAEAVLIDVGSLDATGQPIRAVIESKTAQVLGRRRTALSHSLIKQTLSTATGIGTDVVEKLLEDATVLHAIGGAGEAMQDYQALDGDGLSARYFGTDNLSGAPIVQRLDPLVSFAWLGAAPAPGVPVVGFSVRWTGWVYAPAAGDVTFQVRCSDGVRLKIDDALILDEWRDQPESLFAATVRLGGSRFHALQVEYYNKTGGALLELSWKSPSLPASVVPQGALYSQGRFDELLRRMERIFKIALLLQPFALTAPDLVGLATRGDISLDLLPLVGPASTADAQGMFARWLTLVRFSTLRDRFVQSDVALIDVLTAPSRDAALDRFATLSGVARASLDAIDGVFTTPLFDIVTSTWKTDAPDLGVMTWWVRFADAMAQMKRTGAAAPQLLAWAKTRDIRQQPTGPETLWTTWMALDADGKDRGADNRQLAWNARDAVRSRYDEDAWREVAQALNDTLRERRSGALTAFVLGMPEMMRARVADSARLYEFFLIDPQMSACAETSRIKQGIASVQLFVQRILLGLESPRIPAQRVDRYRWDQSTKLYRVWEANRRMFVYDELFALESLRDDKTPIFEELESELLQADLNDANVELALRHYLEKLDGVAKLVVCGTCVDSNSVTLHVFGRTATSPFAYYHRQLNGARGQSWAEGVWTPWSKLPVDVSTVEDGDYSGAHLLPIVWDRRLYLFWLLFERHPMPKDRPVMPSGFDGLERWHIRLAWSEYKDGRWLAKQIGMPFVHSEPYVVERTSLSNDPNYGWYHNYFEATTINVPEQTYPDPFVGTYTIPAYSYQVPRTIRTDEDDLLGGTNLAVGDWAVHDHQLDFKAIMSVMPRPAEHYLDAKVDGDQLTLRVFARYKGTPSGQSRLITTDITTVVNSGKRTDRREQTQEDGIRTYVEAQNFKQVGVFHFPACISHLDANDLSTDFKYESLVRPEYSTNCFMALRHEGYSPLNFRLGKDVGPMLKRILDPYEVIDADNVSGFNRGGPFFYQDQQRCYLVTRDLLHGWFDRNITAVSPDKRVGNINRLAAFSVLNNRQMSLGVQSNAWAGSALQRWSQGPSMAQALQPVAPSPGDASPTFSLANIKESPAGLFSHFYGTIQGIYTFIPHWHPHTCALISALNAGGIPGLYTLPNQNLSDVQVVKSGGAGGVPIIISTITNFQTVYQPDPAQVNRPYPTEIVDFRRTGSYSVYNWEIFFHIPMLIATSLSDSGQYEAAMRWFHYVFDPMTDESSTTDSRVWQFAPFRTADVTRIEDSLNLLSYTGSDPALLQRKSELLASIQEWLANPFMPHVIARRRPVVYMKRVFIKYLDNLEANIDLLLQRETLEAESEATQLCVLMLNLLGPRPQKMPVPGPVAPETFQTLRSKLDALSNAQVDLETRLPFTQLVAPAAGAIGALTSLPQTLYFCIPSNDALLAYWDFVEDRLFKIRHCMNLEGVVRQLPLFDPPIDPLLLVEATAAGLDISSVLNDLYAPLPRYRFTYMVQQALALCAEVRSLGSTLLAVLEKRDAEKLAALKAGQETALLDLVRGTRKTQIDEAQETLQSLTNASQMASARIDFYTNVLAQGLLSEESDQLSNLDLSNSRQEDASGIELTAQLMNMLPNITIGAPGGTTFGGSNVGAAFSAFARSYSYLAASYAYKANRNSITAAQARRAEDWRLQLDLAKRELKQMERQIAAATLRKAIAESELSSQEMQIDHSRSVEELLRTKFTNESLYGWMEGGLRTVYFQCYQAAYQAARRAERCWQYERGSDATFIKFGAWDSSMRGLLSGERLYLQLQQMEQAYIEPQVREMEITRHISLVQLDPLALVDLKETGVCEFEVPEWLFDLDYPGHYFRRIRSVSLTIPAVAGPYTSVSATLTLLSSKVRESARVQGAYTDEENYRADFASVESIAVSTGQNDNGRFELTFRDDRYAPFEGGGVISRWRLQFPKKYRALDYDLVPDVVATFKYLSRRDEMLTDKALAALQAQFNSADGGVLFRYFSLRHEFPTDWRKLLATDTHTATFTIPKSRFPQWTQSGKVAVSHLDAVLVLKEAAPAVGYKMTLTPGGNPPVTLDWAAGADRYRSYRQDVPIPVETLPEDSGWKIEVTAPVGVADIARVQDLLLVARYTVVL